MAKQGKASDLANKFDAQGRSLLDIENEKLEAEREFAAMIKTIRDTVRAERESGTLAQKKFYFIHFNILCEVEIKLK
jgi:hypothetical protein